MATQTDYGESQEGQRITNHQCKPEIVLAS